MNFKNIYHKNLVYVNKDTYFCSSGKEKMELFSIRDYFEYRIGILNMELVESKQLNKKERFFLLECCLLNYNGVNLNDFDALWVHFEKIGFSNDRNSLSGYKTRLGVKSWIKGKRNTFKLPPHLDIKKADDHFLVWVNGEQKKTKKLFYKKEISVEFGKEDET